MTITGVDARLERRIHVLGCPIDALGVRDTVARCAALIEARRPTQHLSMNVAKLMALPNDEHLEDAVEAADVISADGQGIVWASRLLGSPLPERVAGIDLMYELLRLADERMWRVYFLGGHDAVLERAVAAVRERHPRVVLAGHRNGYFDICDEDALLEEIRRANPDLVFVGISSPKKEAFVARNRPKLAVALWMGVGGALDVLAGRTSEPPAGCRVPGSNGCTGCTRNRGVCGGAI